MPNPRIHTAPATARGDRRPVRVVKPASLPEGGVSHFARYIDSAWSAMKALDLAAEG